MGYDIIFAFAKKMDSENGWKLRSYGGDFDGKIKTLYLEFNLQKESNITESRQELIATVQKFTNFVNEDPGFKDCFYNYPISERDVRLALMYVNRKGTFLKDGKLCVASLRNSELTYYADGERTLNKVLDESFQKAQEQIRKKIACK